VISELPVVIVIVGATIVPWLLLWVFGDRPRSSRP
jgi:hypothetical protein